MFKSDTVANKMQSYLDTYVEQIVESKTKLAKAHLKHSIEQLQNDYQSYEAKVRAEVSAQVEKGEL